MRSAPFISGKVGQGDTCFKGRTFTHIVSVGGHKSRTYHNDYDLVIDPKIKTKHNHPIPEDYQNNK